jgi:hypothetical protein
VNPKASERVKQARAAARAARNEHVVVRKNEKNDANDKCDPENVLIPRLR